MADTDSDRHADYERLQRALEEIHTLSHMATSTTAHGTTTQWRKVADALALVVRDELRPRDYGGVLPDEVIAALAAYDELKEGHGWTLTPPEHIDGSDAS